MTKAVWGAPEFKTLSEGYIVLSNVKEFLQDLLDRKEAIELEIQDVTEQIEEISSNISTMEGI
jgi:chaperonin cofactor prefoldin